MKKLFLLLISILIIKMVNAQKTTVAVAPFTIPSSVEHRYDFHGTGLLDKIPVLLESELFNIGEFELVERARLDAILDEQILTNSGLTESSIDFGKLKGVKYLIMGSISGYSAEIDNVEVKLALKTYYVSTQNISISLTAKLIDIETGKLVKVITTEAKVSEKGRPRSNEEHDIKMQYVDQAAHEVTRKISKQLSETMNLK